MLGGGDVFYWGGVAGCFVLCCVNSVLWSVHAEVRLVLFLCFCGGVDVPDCEEVE